MRGSRTRTTTNRSRSSRKRAKPRPASVTETRRPRALLSLGTNTTRLLVVRDRADGTIEQLDADQVGTRLGEGLRDGGTLSPEGCERTLAALATFARAARDRDASVHAIATSAMRRAADAAAFASRVRDVTGAELEILDGRAEARASYVGATYADRPRGARIGVLDIGGGSTELAIGRDGELAEASSLELGSVRIAEAYPALRGASPGRPAREAAARARARIAETLASYAALAGPDELRCVAGTPLTLVAIAAGTDVARAANRTFSRDDVDATIDALLDRDLAARRALPGMLPQRADILAAGGLILSEAMRLLGAATARATVDDLLLGYLVERAPTK